jgi:hypothetical protein
MSTLLTTTSTTRASLSPSAGDVFFETDTTRIIVYDGTDYVVFNKDGVSFSGGGAEELHYAGGPFSDNTADYFVSEAPVLHFDSARADGSLATPTNIDNMGPQYNSAGNEVNPNGRVWRNRLDTTEFFADNSRNLVYDQTEKAYFIEARNPSTTGVAEDIAGDFTYFLVQKDAGKILGLTHDNNTGKEMLVYDGSNMYLAGYSVGSASTVASDGISGELDLFAVRRTSSTTKLWTLSKAPGIAAGTNRRGATVTSAQSSAKNLHIRSLGRHKTTKLDGYLYEMIVFPTALSQANMDIVHTYIINKYTNRLSHTRKDGTSQIVTDVTDTDQYSLTSI